MKKKIVALVVVSILYKGLLAQTIVGNLSLHANQQIKLLGYSGFETIELAQTTIDGVGNFALTDTTQYKGMGYLETPDKSQLLMVVNEPNITIKGTSLKEPDSIKFKNSIENKIFNQYALEHNQRENALAGWKHILPQYQKIALFNKQKEALKTIQKEIERLEQEDALFLKNIDKTRYVSWFLPLRKLLDDIPLSAQRYTERIPKHISDFRQMNFNDTRLYHSGILDDVIESHYWLIENGGMAMDSMYRQMNLSTDYLIKNIGNNDKLMNEVSDFLFHLLEKRSLFKASEYLALQLLTQNSCTIDDNLTKQLETYRTMKVGNTAPNIIFSGNNRIKNIEVPTLKLNEMNTSYTLVVFGSSWCQKCTEEIPKMLTHYQEWKQKEVEIAFISLDTDEKEYIQFVKEFPWLSSCDFKSWDTQAAKDYHVFSTPTFFLLDKDRKILLRPNSVEQIDAWVTYKI